MAGGRSEEIGRDRRHGDGRSGGRSAFSSENGAGELRLAGLCGLPAHPQRMIWTFGWASFRPFISLRWTKPASVVLGVTSRPSEVADRLAPGHGGQGPVGVRRHRLADEADAAVAEQEVAPAGVDAPEAGG